MSFSISFFPFFARSLRREWLLQVRQLRLIVNSNLFFLMTLVFFPLTLPPDSALLRTLAPGLIWIVTLLSLFLSSERLLQQDYDDGVIEQWLVSGFPMQWFMTAKIIMHWLSSVTPMLLFCPVLALLFALNIREMISVMLSLLCGTPAILSLCAVASAFSTGLKQKGVVMALILLPLAIPIMIFGSAAIAAALQGLAISGFLALLLAMSIVAMVCLPFAVSAIARIGLVD